MENVTSKVVAQEVAEKEVSSWLDFKKIGDTKREQNKESIKSLVDGVVEGVLVINDDKTITHKLKFPILSEQNTDTLTYKPRLNVSTVHKHMAGIKSDNVDGRMLAYVSALTDKAKGILGSLETEDYSIAQSIAVFFL